MDVETAATRVSFELNGKQVAIDAPPLKRLLDVLRHDLGLTGTKNSCGEGDCGACTVLIDGQPVVSCLVPVVQVDGARVRTVESLSETSCLHPLQTAIVEAGAAQCGGCLSGFQMAACGYLESRGCLKTAGGRVDTACSDAPSAGTSSADTLSTDTLSADVPCSDAELRRAVAGVLCRCTGYQRMIEAMRRVAAEGG